MNRGLVIGMIAISCYVMYGAEQFIVKPKPKKISVTQRKEKCGQQLFDLWSDWLVVQKNLLSLQEVGMQVLPRMVDDSFFSNLQHSEYQKVEKTLERMHERQTKIKDLLREQLSDMRSLAT